jgi:predicted metal-dependent hydrolase
MPWETVFTPERIDSVGREKIQIPRVSCRTMSFDWTEGELAEGLRCYRGCEFFAAHEHWEAVWLAAQEPEKTFLQGLIQVAAAFHHFRRGNREGTGSLLRNALRRLDSYPEVFAGLAVAPLREEIRSWLVALDSPAPPEAIPYPQIRTSPKD